MDEHTPRILGPDGETLAPALPPIPEPCYWAKAMAGYFRRTLPAAVQGVIVEAVRPGEDTDALYEQLCGTPHEHVAARRVEGKPVHPGVWNHGEAWDQYERALAIRLDPTLRREAEDPSPAGLSSADLVSHATHEVIAGMTETLRQMLGEPYARPMRVAFLLPVRPPMRYVGWRAGGETYVAYDQNVIAVGVDWGAQGDSLGKQRLRSIIARHVARDEPPAGAADALRELVDRQGPEHFEFELGEVRKALELAGLA